MSTVSVSREIAAPPEEVFRVFSDLPHAAERIEGIKRIEVLSDVPPGVGFRWRETREMFGREHSEEMEMTGFDPPHGYLVEAESCGCHYFSEFTFTAVDSGTRATMSFRGEPISLMAKLMMPISRLFSGTVVRMIGKDLDDLKRAIESPAASPSATPAET
ncbi:Polyketide cyclase / dehydrase and lipid transport [Maioricimonas rarisocia]|uniref:Polyketide cyclase / dehydrase and lipid transport n=1 Tax=Maioricimonas rarisocia TaxID=2528026 RepID=A0A517Z5X3_9PLAN|nr:SRPBCC family protein [Maioricimonas rarisocia]QDU37873.1 Polyketide cyclase / dehydrase and lipid transport [Maioricimonas rarisocia]